MALIEYLSSVPGFDYCFKFYNEIFDKADLRTYYWPLMRSPYFPIAVVLTYLYFFLHGGPSIMKNLPVPNVTKYLIIYNSAVLLLNLILGFSLSWHMYWAKYKFSCQPVRPRGRHEDAITELLWYFHCSKIFELIDTVFLIVKKKDKQLSFLHMYHHSTIIIATWIGVKFVPGGSSAIIAMVNSWVHVFMYFYYEMMVIGVKQFINYKKFVTIMQIVQFVATIVHCMSALKQNCGYPRWVLNALVLYMMSFLVLFIHFYIQTYSRAKPAVLKVEVNDEDNSVGTIGNSPTYNDKKLGSEDEIERSSDTMRNIIREYAHSVKSDFNDNDSNSSLSSSVE